VHPVLRSIPDEASLGASSRAISFDRVAASSDDIIELRQLDDVGIIVVLEERLSLEPGSEDGLEHPLCAFLVGISLA
jgi:hypothetical protein